MDAQIPVLAVTHWVSLSLWHVERANTCFQGFGANCMPKRGNSSGKCGLIVANPPDRMSGLQWSSLNMVFSGNAAGHFLRNWTNGRRYHQATHEQGLRVYRHRERQGHVFHSSNLEGVSYEELQEGQRVSYTEGRGPKGPCAENVKPV